MMELIRICPFCGGRLLRDPELYPESVFHNQPTCQVWNETDDALEFITKVRKRLGLPAPEGN